MKGIILKIVMPSVILAVFASVYFYLQFRPADQVEWGLSFSTSHAQYLGFDWKTLYLDMLNDLKPKKLRLMAYWEMIEPSMEKFDFQTMDEMLIEAGKRNIEVILVLGHKQPRWPECHHPAWYNDLSADQKENAQLAMVENAVSHFKQFSAVKVWQVENEPLFGFGPDCPQTDREFLKEEIALVRSLDSRLILLTDSGELGRFFPTAKFAPDIFGSTMYRVVHNRKIGYFKYPLPSAFFRIKAGLLKKFTGINDIIGVELQAEPWYEDDVFHTDLNTQNELMNPKIFAENANYAKNVGFRENYLWGVEWSYWLARRHNDWGMWQAMKDVLNE